MRIRILSLLLACTMAAAPSLVVACEVVCAAADATRSSSMPVEHACHHVAIPSVSAIAATLHACGHGDGELATSGEKAPAALAVAVVAVFIVDPIATSDAWVTASDIARARPPDRSLKRVPLRI
jgi:hypothetical protein